MNLHISMDVNSCYATPPMTMVIHSRSAAGASSSTHRTPGDADGLQRQYSGQGVYVLNNIHTNI